MKFHFDRLSEYSKRYRYIGSEYNGNLRYSSIKFINAGPKRLSYTSLREETTIEISDAKNNPTHCKLSQSYESTNSKLSECCNMAIPINQFSR